MWKRASKACSGVMLNYMTDSEERLLTQMYSICTDHQQVEYKESLYQRM